MIRHIVLLSFKKNLNEEQIHQIFLALENLLTTIPQIQSFSWGKGNSPENLNKGFTHGFCMEFANIDDREIYLKHPHHLQLVEQQILPSLEEGLNSALVFDYSL